MSLTISAQHNLDHTNITGVCDENTKTLSVNGHLSSFRVNGRRSSFTVRYAYTSGRTTPVYSSTKTSDRSQKPSVPHLGGLLTTTERDGHKKVPLTTRWEGHTKRPIKVTGNTNQLCGGYHTLTAWRQLRGGYHTLTNWQRRLY